MSSRFYERQDMSYVPNSGYGSSDPLGTGPSHNPHYNNPGPDGLNWWWLVLLAVLVVVVVFGYRYFSNP